MKVTKTMLTGLLLKQAYLIQSLTSKSESARLCIKGNPNLNRIEIGAIQYICFANPAAEHRTQTHAFTDRFLPSGGRYCEVQWTDTLEHYSELSSVTSHVLEMTNSALSIDTCHWHF